MRRPFLIGLLAVAAVVALATVAGRLFPRERPEPKPAGAPAPSTRPEPSAVPAVGPRAPVALRPKGPPPTSLPASTRAPRLRVTSDVPGASVFVDHKHVGTAPVELADIAVGPHRLNVSADGYEMYAETVEIGETPNEVAVRFKQVRLEESLPVVHKHGLGSCSGRLVATNAGLAYESERKQDTFRFAFSDLEPLEIDYLAKNLRVKQRGGRTFNFTDPGGNADALLVFRKKVEAARARLGAGGS